jgi:hypothetical protein
VTIVLLLPLNRVQAATNKEIFPCEDAANCTSGFLCRQTYRGTRLSARVMTAPGYLLE